MKGGLGYASQLALTPRVHPWDFGSLGIRDHGILGSGLPVRLSAFTMADLAPLGASSEGDKAALPEKTNKTRVKQNTSL